MKHGRPDPLPITCTDQDLTPVTFLRRHLTGVEPSPEIPAVHLRLPRPYLRETVAHLFTIDAIADAYECGYSMRAIARQLGLHPSTISRRLSRHRAQIKT